MMQQMMPTHMKRIIPLTTAYTPWAWQLVAYRLARLALDDYLSTAYCIALVSSLDNV